MIDKIICGDSIELIKSIDNEYVHAIIPIFPMVYVMKIGIFA